MSGYYDTPTTPDPFGYCPTCGFVYLAGLPIKCYCNSPSMQMMFMAGAAAAESAKRSLVERLKANAENN